MSEDATPKGVSKTPDQNKAAKEAAVAEIRKNMFKEESEARGEIAQRHREHRDAELAEAGLEVEDTSGEPGESESDVDDKDNQNSNKKGNDGVNQNDNENNSQNNVDSDDEFDTLTIDGKETKVSKSKIFETGKRAMQKELASDTRLEEATRILNEARATAEQLQGSSSQPSPDVDDTAAEKVDTAALAKTLVDGDVDEVAEAIGKIMGTGRQKELATQAVNMQPNEVFNLVEGALQMKDAMDLFEMAPESGGYGDLYSDETMRQMVFDREAELAKAENPESPKARLKQAAESVREWRNGIVKQSGGTVVDFEDRSSKKANAESTVNSASGRTQTQTNEQPLSEAEKRRQSLNNMARSRGQHLD